MKFNSNTMNINFKDAVGYLTFKNLEKYSFLKHAFSTRLGGVSTGYFKSMNLSFSQGDDEKLVNENYNIFCNALNFDINKLVLTKQIHENVIKCVFEKDIQSGNISERGYFGIDGLVTNVPGIVLTTFHADCTAIFMVDPIKKVIGLAHAGWKGTVKWISKNLLDTFISKYGSSPKDVVCSIGPAICGDCFEVSEDILPEFEKLNIEKSYLKKSDKKGKINIDLPEVNRQILLQSGVLESNIIKSNVCTKCNSDLLFSHRATNGKRGGCAAFLSLT